MKKTMVVIITGLLLSLFTQTCFAESIQSEVYAKYNCNQKFCGMFNLDNGSATASIAGITVSVNELPFDNGFLYVKMISENDKEAFAWLKNCLPSQSDNIVPLEICIKDQFGHSYSVSSEIPITVSIPNANDVRVFHINETGVCKEILFSVNSNIISFKTALNGHTILTYSSTSIHSPLTGDNNYFGLWIAIMILSLCGLTVTLLIGKKEKRYQWIR